jgi:type III pantothenate kinase
MSAGAGKGNFLDKLLIDVGNGRVKLGLERGGGIAERREVMTRGINEAEVERACAGWSWDQAVLCSVVPAAVPPFRSVLGAGLVELRHDMELGIGIEYPAPETIGPDRLANAVALAALHGAPGVVIDFGTAVTFDVVSRDRCYAGGIIAPGLRLMTDYLHERTALLPRVELREPERAIGKSTEQAILSGAALGYRGMVSGILRALLAELGAASGEARLVATGGDAEWIVAGMEESITCDPDLTLRGLSLVGNIHASCNHG